MTIKLTSLFLTNKNTRMWPGCLARAGTQHALTTLLLALVAVSWVSSASATVAEQNAARRAGAPDKVAQVQAGKLDEARADWWGFNAEDATASLQAALTSGVRRLTIPNMGTPWIVNPLHLPSDLELTLEPGTIVEAIRGGFKGRNDVLFQALGQSNIVIRGTGATFRMHKRDYQDESQYERAEWRHTLSLLSCENVLVEGLTLQSSGGDGIYISRRREQRLPYCKDIIIRDCVIDDNHRQGISVICVHNLLIEGCLVSNTRGTPPQAGIDFEGAPFYKVEVRNSTFLNNVNGIIIQTHIDETSPPMSFAFDNCQMISNSFAADFGSSQPPMSLLDCTMTNCVEIGKDGRVKRLDDFWRDLMHMQQLTQQEEELVKSIAKMDLTQVKLKPVQGAVAPVLPKGVAKPRPETPNQRGPFQYVMYAEKGDTVAFTASFRRVGGGNKPMTLKVKTPSGEAVPLKFPVVKNTPETFSFTANASGTYIISCDPEHSVGAIMPARPLAEEGLTIAGVSLDDPLPVAMLAQERPFHFFGQAGTFYFYVPAGVSDFYVMAAGVGNERIKAAVYDPAGKQVAMADDICLAHRMFIHREDASKGEVWLLQTSRATNYYLEDYSIDLYGIPPILATTLEGLLVP